MRLGAAALALLLLFNADAARAHAPVPGLEGFPGGLLHPLLVPAHLLALLGLGLFIGQQRSRLSTALFFAAGLLAGLGAIASAVGETPANSRAARDHCHRRPADGAGSARAASRRLAARVRDRCGDRARFPAACDIRRRGHDHADRDRPRCAHHPDSCRRLRRRTPARLATHRRARLRVVDGCERYSRARNALCK